MSRADGKWDKDAFPKQKYEDENLDREPQWWDKNFTYYKRLRTWSKQDLLDYANQNYNPYLPSRQSEDVDGVMHELWRRYGIAYGD